MLDFSASIPAGGRAGRFPSLETGKSHVLLPAIHDSTDTKNGRWPGIHPALHTRRQTGTGAPPAPGTAAVANDTFSSPETARVTSTHCPSGDTESFSISRMGSGDTFVRSLPSSFMRYRKFSCPSAALT